MSRLAWAVVCLLVVLLLAVGTAVAGWWFSPHWLPRVAKHYAPQYGIEIQVLKLAAPRMDGVHIQQIKLRQNSNTIVASNVDVVYERHELQAGKIRKLHIAHLELTVGPSTDKGPAKPLPDPRTLWGLVPAEQIDVAEFVVVVTEPGVHIHGKANFNAAALATDLIVDAPERARGYNLRMRVSRKGLLQAALRSPAPDALLIADASAQWSGGQGQGVLGQNDSKAGGSGRVAVRVHAAPTSDQLRDLGALWQLNSTRANLKLDVATDFPWPLPQFADRDAGIRFAEALALSGAIQVDWSGSRPGLAQNLALRANARFKRLRDSVEVQLSSGMLCAGDLLLERPLILFAQPISGQFRISGDSPVQVRVANNVLEARGKLRAELGDDSAWVHATTQELRADISALSAGKPEGLHSRLALSMQLPKSSFGRFTAKADITAQGNGPLLEMAIARGAQISLGRLGDWSRGETRARGATPIRAQLDPRLLQWRTGPVHADITLPKGDFAGTDVRFAPARLRLEAAEGTGGAKVNASGELSSIANARDNSLRFTAVGKVGMRGNDTNTAIELRLGKTDLRFGIVVTYNLQHKSGTLQVHDAITWNQPLLHNLLGTWQEPGDSSSGSLRADLGAQFQFVGTTTRLHSNGTITLKNVAATYADYRLKGIDARTAYQLVNQDLRVTDAQLHMGEAFVGTEVRSIDALWRFANGVVSTAGIRAELLGGKVSTNAFDYRLKPGDADLEVSIDGMQLAELLTLQHEDLKGDGVIDGKLPLSVRSNVAEVRGGKVAARPPGGTIAYAKANDYAGNISQEGFRFAISALSDFHYTRMESSIDYNKEHVLNLGVKLYGHNPTVENGRPINYNLNVGQNVADLLRSLRTADEVSRQLEAKLQRR